MSVRQDVIDAMAKHFEDQRGHPPEQMHIEDLTDYADAVLRVLAEHGGTQQVEEELVSSGALVLPRGDRINAVMTVVAPLIGYYRSVAEHWLKRAERAEADLAAVRDTVKRMHINDGDRDVVTYWVRQLLDVLDAPARPAGHDEAGQ